MKNQIDTKLNVILGNNFDRKRENEKVKNAQANLDSFGQNSKNETDNKSECSEEEVENVKEFKDFTFEEANQYYLKTMDELNLQKKQITV